MLSSVNLMGVFFAGVGDSRLTLRDLDEFSLVDRDVLIEGEAAGTGITGSEISVRYAPKLSAGQGVRFKIIALVLMSRDAPLTK